MISTGPKNNVWNCERFQRRVDHLAGVVDQDITAGFGLDLLDGPAKAVGVLQIELTG